LTGLPTFGTPALDVTPPPSSGVAGLARTDEPPVSEVTYIELRVEEADLPASHLFFVNIIVFYLHVYLVRGAGRLIEVEEGPELTVKEKEVLQWIASGKTSWEVGKILSVSERTVKFHLRNIYAKLGVATRAQAATKASRLGLL
jgi:DNA-binding CsgD family transcriptional regulator